MEYSQKNEVQNSEFKIVPFLLLCYHVFLAKWRWFAFSIIVCVACGWYYQQIQPRVYTRQATMLIEGGNGNGRGGFSSSRNRGSGLNTMMDFNGVTIGDNLSNELFILTTRRLMRKVVDSLGLDVDYTTKNALHRIALYDNRPFDISFGTKTGVPASFQAEILSGGKVRLFDFKLNGEEYSDDIETAPEQAIKTPLGILKISKNATFEEFPKGKAITVDYIPADLAARRYQGEVSATVQDQESSLIVLTCQDINIARATDIINTLFSCYKQDVVDNKNRVGQNTAHFIDERLSLIGSELAGVEGRLASLKESNRIVDFKTAADQYSSMSVTARQSSVDLQSQVSVARYLKDFMQNNSNKHQLIPVLNLPDATFAGLVNEYNTMMIERNSTEKNSSPNSPLVKDLDSKLTTMRNTILSSVRSYVKTLEMRAQSARSNESVINGEVSRAPGLERRALSIGRQQNLKEALYTYLMNKREEVALQLAVNDANVRLVEDPLGSNTPISPNRSTIILISLLIGLLIPTLILTIRRLMDITVSGRHDVEETTTIPLVGELPTWEEGGDDGLITTCSSDAPIVEAFRMLRYGLNFMRHSAKVCVVTSSTPGQGKSFISRNLAAIMGMANKRVLLVDADIRKRTLSSKFGRSNGLTGWLVDEEEKLSLDEIIIKDGVAKQVDFLPAGMLPPNPSELLMSSRLEALVEEARELYDFIIIDTTPILAVSDASIVDRVADVTLFVIRVGVQVRAFLPELEKMNKDKKYRHLCIALNDVDVKAKYGYGYGYGYGNYGYGNYSYGYGGQHNNRQSKKKLSGRLLSKLRK